MQSPRNTLKARCDDATPISRGLTYTTRSVDTGHAPEQDLREGGGE